jgi:hypothetical protein
MSMLTELLQEILLKESVSVNDIDDAMDNHKRVIINYHSKGEDIATGARVIEVYAYGLTKAGNPVIRAFQPFGDTTSKVPSWKFFRLDRISAWQETNQTFNKPASEIYRGLGDFNPNDDRTMSIVYKITTFGDDEKELSNIVSKTNPKLKSNLFKTDTEKNMERLKQQVINPIKLSDIKTKDGFKNISEPSNDTGPKLKQQTSKESELYRTDTERAMERLKQQLENPRKIDLNTVGKSRQKQQKPENTEQELADLRKKLGDTSRPITIKDLNDRLSGKTEQPYRTDTERAMERLKQQLENPRKIDLSKLPKR